jgi:CDP-6-deoxy-D-xylo-4-hexulose-3-dehydrase
LDKYIQKRNENYKKFVELISTHTSNFYVPLVPQTCSNFCFPLICKTKELADKMRRIFDEVGIEHRPIISGNLLRQPFLSGYDIITKKDNLNVDYIHDNGIYLGNNHFVGDKELNLLKDILKKL